MSVCELDKVFNKMAERETWIGAELEVYVLREFQDNYDDIYEVNLSDSLVKQIYSRLDERIYRDFYPYQLEIRTFPHNDPKETAKELIDLFREANNIAKELGCKLVPVSYLEGQMYNGMHVHISYTPKIENKEMIKNIIAAYPFIFDVARLTLSSPRIEEYRGRLLSCRVLHSPHIGLIPAYKTINELEHMWTEDIKYDCTHRYYDIVINTHKKNGRERIKNTNTIEIRMFDSVGSKSTILQVMELTYAIFRFVDPRWIEKFRKNYSSRCRFTDICDVLRYNMILPHKYINAFTGTDAIELADYFNIPVFSKESWIIGLLYDFNSFGTPKFQGTVDYLMP